MLGKERISGGLGVGGRAGGADDRLAPGLVAVDLEVAEGVKLVIGTAELKAA